MDIVGIERGDEFSVCDRAIEYEKCIGQCKYGRLYGRSYDGFDVIFGNPSVLLVERELVYLALDTVDIGTRVLDESDQGRDVDMR